jgi:hypothetical protein
MVVGELGVRFDTDFRRGARVQGRPGHAIGDPLLTQDLCMRPSVGREDIN